MTDNYSKIYKAYKYIGKLLTNFNKYKWPNKKVIALYFLGFYYLEILFGNEILSIKLQKSDLKKIFYYAYKYKIAIYIGSLLFY